MCRCVLLCLVGVGLAWLAHATHARKDDARIRATTKRSELKSFSEGCQVQLEVL